MSPLSLRRYRAERLLQRQFDALEARVLAAVRARLRARGPALADDDLEACYAQAWQGLYRETLEGREVIDPCAWLVLVCFRRAIEEQRARASSEAVLAQIGRERRIVHLGARDPDLAAELDDRARLRQLFEGLGARLNRREREAAALCYLHGLSRAQAAAQMGISERAMRKLMEGSGRGRPGVAAKVGELVRTIRDGDWCEQQSSSMRALAYGILDPAGERYRLALAHRDECPSCRAYVASLRGLAAALPPVLLHPGAGSAAIARLLAGAHHGARGSAGRLAGAGAARPIATAAPASAVAGSGGTVGGGWLLSGGPLVGKLVVGCAVALSVGAGCVALEHGGGRGVGPRPHTRSVGGARAAGADRQTPQPAAPAAVVVLARRNPAVGDARLSPPARAAREFGLERELAGGGGSGGAERARTAAVDPREATGTQAPAARPSAGSEGAVHAGGAGAAAREFAPG